MEMPVKDWQFTPEPVPRIQLSLLDQCRHIVFLKNAWGKKREREDQFKKKRGEWNVELGINKFCYRLHWGVNIVPIKK